MERALDPATPVIHPELGDNLTFERKLDVGDVDGAFANAAAVVEHTFRFGRHTGVTLEPRAILADYDPAEHRLTIYHSFQAPHMMQDIVARHLDIPAANVRVICRDVGGSFGIKVHIYPDEMATVALSVLLRRPVKFVADRLESFVSDIHARDHRVKGRLALAADGAITAIEIDDLTGIGPYSVYPRTSGIEANQVVNLTGAPYRHQNYRARARVVFQNKNVMCQYRAVGHPIAVAVTEALVDSGARALGMDPGRDPPPQPDPGRRLPVHQRLGHEVRAPVPSCGARQAARDDGLRGAAGRAGAPARSRASFAASALPRSSR